MTSVRARTRWRPNRTLRGRLTVGLVGILLLACALLGAATAVFLRSFLLSQLDGQLAAAGGRFSASLEHGKLAPGGEDADADNAVPGQSVGTIGVRLVDGRVTQAAIVADDGTNRSFAFPAADTATLTALVPGGGPISADLDAVGDYRLDAVAGEDGDVQITGLPLHSVNQTLARLAAIEAVVFGGLVVAGGVTTAVVVRRTLRPLERVSATALHVSELPLTDADTALPTSIAPAHPTSEVDQVSVAFDHMLEHVRSALASRDATEARLRQFVADASHELRTPLATIRAHAEYAGIADGPPSAPVSEALGRIAGGHRPDGHPGQRPAAARPARCRPPARPRTGRPHQARPGRRRRRPSRRPRSSLAPQPARGRRHRARRRRPTAPGAGQPADQRQNPHPDRDHVTTP